MYWFLNKKTDKAGIYTVLTTLMDKENIDKEDYANKFYRIFSRLKKTKFNDDNYRIEKMDPVKSKRMCDGVE